MHESVRLDVMDSLAGRKLKYLNASHQIGGWAGYKFVFYKFTIELNYSKDQNKYSDYDSDDKYSVYVSGGPGLDRHQTIAGYGRKGHDRYGR